jgi:hypothetical protein
MHERSTSSRLNRLEGLEALLKTKDHVTVAELAAELGVSIRDPRIFLAEAEEGIEAL